MSRCVHLASVRLLLPSLAFTPGEEWRVLIWGLGWIELFTDMALDILCEMLYTCSMKQMLTAKLKLHTNAAQFQALRTTQLAYRDALNAVSRYSFAHGKKSNQQWLQQETYAEVRAIYHLPAQMACNVPRQVGATYKTLWSAPR
jgi:predicted transposase